jgi:hypothetical protein
MDALGINLVFVIIQVLIFSAIPALSIFALLALRRSHITGITHTIWAFFIVAIPVLGALAFFIVKPTENIQS